MFLYDLFFKPSHLELLLATFTTEIGIGLEPAPEFADLPTGYNAYAIECRDGTYYIGMTSSLRHRITQHYLGIGSVFETDYRITSRN